MHTIMTVMSAHHHESGPDFQHCAREMSGVALEITMIRTWSISPICSLYPSIEKLILQNLTVHRRSKLKDKDYHNL